jgi:hypothetical protein
MSQRSLVCGCRSSLRSDRVLCHDPEQIAGGMASSLLYISQRKREKRLIGAPRKTLCASCVRECVQVIA